MPSREPSTLGQYTRKYSYLDPNNNYYNTTRGYAPGGVYRGDYDRGILGGQLLDNIAKGENVYDRDPWMAWGGLIGSVLADQYNKRGEEKNRNLFDSMLKGEEVGSRKEGYQPKTMSENIAKGTENAINGKTTVGGTEVTAKQLDPLATPSQLITLAGQVKDVEHGLVANARRDAYNAMYSDPDNPNPGALSATMAQSEAALDQIPNIFYQNVPGLLEQYKTRLRADGVRGQQLDEAMAYAESQIQKKENEQAPQVLGNIINEYNNVRMKQGANAAQDFVLGQFMKYPKLTEKLAFLVERADRDVATQNTLDRDNRRLALEEQRVANEQKFRENSLALEREKVLRAAEENAKNREFQRELHGLKNEPEEEYLYEPKYMSSDRIKMLQEMFKNNVNNPAFIESLKKMDSVLERDFRKVARGDYTIDDGLNLGKKYKKGTEREFAEAVAYKVTHDDDGRLIPETGTARAERFSDSGVEKILNENPKYKEAYMKYITGGVDPLAYARGERAGGGPSEPYKEPDVTEYLDPKVKEINKEVKEINKELADLQKKYDSVRESQSAGMNSKDNPSFDLKKSAEMAKLREQMQDVRKRLAFYEKRLAFYESGHGKEYQKLINYNEDEEDSKN